MIIIMSVFALVHLNLHMLICLKSQASEDFVNTGMINGKNETMIVEYLSWFRGNLLWSSFLCTVICFRILFDAFRCLTFAVDFLL